ncbi:MAG TPA: lysophospholipid acyltransferase family protein [Armatimonadota bacterium]|nr:lysophospholipid acyltransferase family protein [Armatimonadota bacterium]
MFRFLYWILSPALRLALFLLGPVHVFGLENVPKSGPVLLAANHTSYLDPLVVGFRCPRYVHFLGTRDVFDRFLIGFLARCMGGFPVDKAGMENTPNRVSVRFLRYNEAVLIFPEGKRTRGIMATADSSIAQIALKAGVPVHPVLITGTHRSFSRDHPWFGHGKITVTFGKPIEIDAANDPISLAHEAQRVMNAIEALRAETPGAPPPLRNRDLPVHKHRKRSR